MSLTALDAHWAEMVTAALLGTDRREPPTPPAGGLADLAADDPRPTPSSRLLQQVAGCMVVRRAGLLPGASVDRLAAPQPDPRPITPPSATATWRRMVADWPVLEDEWMLAVVAGGRRLAPELVPPVLARHRSDIVRHTRALIAAGPLGRWMIGWSPRLDCGAKRPVGLEHAVASLPELAILPELQPLLAGPAGGPRGGPGGGPGGSTDRPFAEPGAVLGACLGDARYGAGHRAVLVNFVARVTPAALGPLVAALQRVDPSSPSIGVAYALSDLAALRHHMLAELEPT